MPHIFEHPYNVYGPSLQDDGWGGRYYAKGYPRIKAKIARKIEAALTHPPEDVVDHLQRALFPTHHRLPQTKQKIVLSALADYANKEASDKKYEQVLRALVAVLAAPDTPEPIATHVTDLIVAVTEQNERFGAIVLPMFLDVMDAPRARLSSKRTILKSLAHYNPQGNRNRIGDILDVAMRFIDRENARATKRDEDVLLRLFQKPSRIWLHFEDSAERRDRHLRRLINDDLLWSEASREKALSLLIESDLKESVPDIFNHCAKYLERPTRIAPELVLKGLKKSAYEKTLRPQVVRLLGAIFTYANAFYQPKLTQMATDIAIDLTYPEILTKNADDEKAQELAAAFQTAATDPRVPPNVQQVCYTSAHLITAHQASATGHNALKKDLKLA